jgi:glycosyltransferase involved in cell wall biosynthesis
MTASIIIPTYRRPKELARCLGALQKQIRATDEILVALRDDDKETQAFLKKVQADFPTLRIVKVTKPGQVAALNAGLDKVKGDIIVFTDDDTVPRPDWLKRIEAYFQVDPELGGVGGKDWYYYDGQKLNEVRRIVGKLYWFGLIISNHHLGGGKPRLVDHLKGANMSFRRKALSGIRFQVSIDHYIAKRYDEDQRGKFNTTLPIENMAFNETLVLLEHFSSAKRIIYILWALLVGNRGTRGVALFLRALVRGKKDAWPSFVAALRGRYEGWKEWLSDRKRENVHPADRMISKPHRPYRVAFLVSHVVQYHVPLYRALAANEKIDLTVYFCSDWGAREYLEPEYGINIKWDRPLLDGYNYRILRNRSPKPAIGNFFGMINPGIITELLRCKYDALIIHGYHLASCWFGYIGARLSRTPVFLRGEMALRPNRPLWIRIAKRLILPVFFKGTNAFFSLGSKTDEFYKFFGIADDRIFFTPYTVDNNFFMEESQKWEGEKLRLKTSLGIPEELPVILFVGKLIRRKRPFDLIYAYEGVRDKAALLFVGEGALRQELEQHARNRGLPKVVFAGFKNQSELPKYYAMSDIFVLPSSKEVCPLVINEAMCCRLPVIASDAIPFAEDFIDEGKNGCIFPCGNVQRLKTILSAILENGELRNSMGLCSQERIKKWNDAQAVESILKAMDIFAKRI